jgi:hypothetical protein
MRRMPNDTIVVSVGTQQFVTEFGDPGLLTMTSSLHRWEQIVRRVQRRLW